MAISSVTGPNYSREEFSFNVHGFTSVPVSERMTATLFGGATRVRVTQDLLVSARLVDHGWWTVGVYDLRAAAARASAWGGVMGFDLSVYLSEHIGVGSLVQYQFANVPLQGTNGVVATVRTGGLQVGGGLRIRF